ncbi:hypothetical protein NUSPORA_02871 [Nucleospora cyclopteri]
MIKVKITNAEDEGLREMTVDERTTIDDIRTELHLKESEGMFLLFKGKILTGNTPLYTLGKTVELQIGDHNVKNIKEDTKIGQEILIKDGKKFVVVSRSRKLNFIEKVLKKRMEIRNKIRAWLKNNATYGNVNFVVLMLFLARFNFVMFCFTLFINILKVISNILAKNKQININHFCRTILMFFCSMFLIDHSKIFKY